MSRSNRSDFAGSVDPNDHGTGFTACLFHGCLAELRALCLRKDREGDPGSISTAYWNELDKLYLWGVPFEDGKMSIALEASEKLRVKVVSLLQSVAKALLTCQCDTYERVSCHRLLRLNPEIVSPKGSAKYQSPTIETETSPDLASLLERAETIISDADRTASPYAGDESDQSDYDSETSSIGENSVFENIQFGIARLMELAPTLQKNLVRGREARTQHILSSPQPFRVSKPAETYVKIAQEKFKQADLNLVQRLGQASWQRHRRIREMMYGSDESDKEEPTTEHSTFRPPPTFHDSGLGTTISSASQYAASVASHTSFASIIHEEGTKSLRVPPMPPHVANGKPFTCPICGRLQSKIKNRNDWK